MLAAQMIATHHAATECLRRAMVQGQTFEGRDQNLKHATKLLGLYERQLAALDKHRGRGQQKITVEHVNVHACGHAIVGNVDGSSQSPSPAASPDASSAPPTLSDGRDERVTYLSEATATRVKSWLCAADLHEGPLFRGLHTGKLSDRPLDTSSMRRPIKAAARRAELEPSTVQTLSGHSMRVGTAQDMMVAGADIIGIMQAGGWKSHAVLSRYVENASAIMMHERRWQELETMNEH